MVDVPKDLEIVLAMVHTMIFEERELLVAMENMLMGRMKRFLRSNLNHNLQMHHVVSHIENGLDLLQIKRILMMTVKQLVKSALLLRTCIVELGVHGKKSRLSTKIGCLSVSSYYFNGTTN